MCCQLLTPKKKYMSLWINKSGKLTRPCTGRAANASAMHVIRSVEVNNRHPNHQDARRDDGDKRAATLSDADCAHAQKIARLCSQHTTKYGKGWNSHDNRQWRPNAGTLEEPYDPALDTSLELDIAQGFVFEHEEDPST